MPEGLLIIDMLNDFIKEGAPLELPSAREIIPTVRAYLEEARQKEKKIIFICDSHRENDEEFKLWPPHAIKGTEGAKIIEELCPNPGEEIIYKRRYSGFFETSLDESLKKAQVKKLTLTGILTNICVLFTAADAVMRGYKVSIPQTAVATRSEEEQRFTLHQMQEILGVEVI